MGWSTIDHYCLIIVIEVWEDRGVRASRDATRLLYLLLLFPKVYPLPTSSKPPQLQLNIKYPNQTSRRLWGISQYNFKLQGLLKFPRIMTSAPQNPVEVPPFQLQRLIPDVIEPYSERSDMIVCHGELLTWNLCL